MDNEVKTKSIVKKIICLALIIMMLTSNFITPITIWANEQNSTIAEDSTIINEESGTDASISTPSEKSGESENTSKTSEEENKENTDTLGVENSTNENNNTSNEENSTTESDNNSNKANTDDFAESKSNSKVNLLFSSENESSIEKLKDRIKPAIKDDITIKTKNDNHEINQFNIQFVSGGAKDENGNLVWEPENSAYGHEFTFRVNYAMSGLYELPAESIQITIPKSILRNRSGNPDDNYIMSLPTSEEYDGTTEFAYIENEDYIIVYNPGEVKAGINGYFEIAYATKSTTFNYKDYDPANTDTVANGGTASDPFYAIITVKSGEDTLANISDEKNVYINTNAKITSTQKRYPTLYRTWDTSWMEQVPEDSDEYYYLVWEIRTYIQSPTQRYNFTISDVVTDLTKDTDGQDYELVGYKLSGEKYYSDKNTQTNVTRDEYRYDYVLTRHKISTYKDIEYTLKNTVTATVDPIDQVDSDTKATSSNTFSWDPAFTPPAGHFNLFKYGNNNWYSRFYNYWDYANYDLNKLQKEEVNELKGF